MYAESVNNADVSILCIGAAGGRGSVDVSASRLVSGRGSVNVGASCIGTAGGRGGADIITSCLASGWTRVVVLSGISASWPGNIDVID